MAQLPAPPTPPTPDPELDPIPEPTDVAYLENLQDFLETTATMEGL